MTNLQANGNSSGRHDDAVAIDSLRAQLYAKVEGRFGVLPNFFRLPPGNPEITTNLFGFAQFAYLDNPLPSLFKERLFVYLSRFCDVRYCIVRHVGFLSGLGNPAGDPQSPIHSVDEVIRLITRPLPRREALETFVGKLHALAAPLSELPEADSALEEALFACATHAFLQTPNAPQCLVALRHALGESAFHYLLVFLAFVRTAHYWTKVQTDLQLEEDVTQLLASHEKLAEALLHAPEAMTSEAGQTLLNELAFLREEQQRQGELLREQQVLTSSKDRLLHSKSTEIAERMAELQKVNSELRHSRRAAFNLMEDAIRSRETLHERDEQLRNALVAGRMAYWTWDIPTDTVVAAETMEDLFGLLPGEHWQTSNQLVRLIHPKDRARYQALVEAGRQGDKGWHTEFRIVRPRDGQLAWLEERAHLAQDPHTGQARITGLVWDITERKELEGALQQAKDGLEQRVAERTAALRHSEAQLRTLATELTRAEHQERRRISQMLHDDIQQLLYAIQMRVRLLRDDLVADDHAALEASIQEADSWLDDAVRLTRQLTVDLSPPLLKEEGLVAALQWLVRQLAELHGLHVTIQAAQPFRLMDEALQALLFQLVRELLFNVVRHAQTDQATVEIQSGEEELLYLTISDPGCGFDVATIAAQSNSGFGLFSVRERIVLFGGRMEIQSAPGQGTRIVLAVPINLAA